MRQSLFKSFKNAYSGLINTVKHERNLQIHFLVSFLVILFALFFHIKTWEFVIVILFCLLIIILEFFNTIFEKIVDFMKPQMHSYVKTLKDMMAATVLISAIVAVIVGLIIFIPYIKAFLF